MGLYGWMSIRPFPFFLYYPVISLLFLVGFLSSPAPRQSFFAALLLLSFLVLWIIPTLAQARYYPLLALVFWGMVVSGAQKMKIHPVWLFVFVLLATAAGCGLTLVNML